jgi:hypothetical protein
MEGIGLNVLTLDSCEPLLLKGRSGLPSGAIIAVTIFGS